MITREQVVDVLKNREDDGIGDVCILPEGIVEAWLVTEINTQRPYPLRIELGTDNTSLRITAFCLGNCPPDGSLMKEIAMSINPRLRVGTVGISRSRLLFYRINHISEGNNGFSLEHFNRIFDEAIAAIDYIETTVISCFLRDAGVPEERATQVIKFLIGPEDAEDVEDVETEQTL